MLLWFAGFAVVAVWFVFRDPRFDLRILVLGALLPDVLDGPTGRAGVFHSLTASVAVLVVVMLATIGRRAARRRWLALPIGMFLHLIADGAFALTSLFWWPFSGLDLGDHPLPSLERGWWNVPLELLGALALLWAWRRFGLSDPQRRRTLVREGTVQVVH